MVHLLAILRLLEKLKLDPESSLAHRIRIQKAVYLAQSLGMPFGYRFAWDRFGPYSPELGSDVGMVVEDRELLDARAETIEWPAEAQRVFAQVKALAEAPSDWSGEIEWLEVLSSLHFTGAACGLSDPWIPMSDQRIQVEKQLLGAKPHFKDVCHKFPEAWDRLGLVKGGEASAN